MNEVKNFTPMDLALLRRLASRGLSLDTVALIRDANPLETAMLGAVGLIGRGRPTFILRTEQEDYAAQIHVEGTRARLILVAPCPQPEHPTNTWLTLLENLLEQAGRRGAYLVTAEVPINGVALELFRRTGFTVYSRQNLYYLEKPAFEPAAETPQLLVRPVQDDDYPRLNALYTSTVPKLVQQADPPPSGGWEGLAVLLDGRLRGYICTWQGKQGILLQPYFHPELYDLAGAAFQQAITHLGMRRVYVRMLTYQEWLRRPLEQELGFVEWATYALMVRHTTVTVRETSVFSPLAALESMTLSPGIEVALERYCDDTFS